MHKRCTLIVLLGVLVCACATLPGADYPKQPSVALVQPAGTRLGRQLATQVGKHPGVSGFRLLVEGTDGLRTRLDLVAAAERTLDLQYFTIQSDTTGQLLINSVLHAADRGVRVRLLIDDTDDVQRDRQLIALAGHPRIELRLFNPFYTRGVLDLLRYAEFMVAGQRLNYRMHNKVFIVDNAAAVIGGRNVGDEYFQASAEKEFGDFDVLAVGPLVQQISANFDEYWNSSLAIPIQALIGGKPSTAALEQYRAELEQNQTAPNTSAYLSSLGRTNPAPNLVARESAFIWARAELLYDSPEKAKVQDGEEDGSLLRRRLGEAVRSVKSELLIVSPYLVPGDGGMRLLDTLRQRDVRVRILTNSLASTDMPIVHAGYRHYRTRMLEDGVQLYEVRPTLGKPEGSGGSGLKSPSSGQFALHAKVFVLDRQRLFVGSMNFDRRSLRLNTEIGVLIESPELARQVVARFDAIAQPANCYIPALGVSDATGSRPITWRTEENGETVETTIEPAGDLLRAVKVQFLTLLPIDDLL
jgi:cardiolipin synthase C